MVSYKIIFALFAFCVVFVTASDPVPGPFYGSNKFYSYGPARFYDHGPYGSYESYKPYGPFRGHDFDKFNTPYGHGFGAPYGYGPSFGYPGFYGAPAFPYSRYNPF
ncbi:hypothetical protein FO519_006526 [Halicephalobus sp. NKZ332]|nr:hypothetical protein FO519_006526 [Halicephalobus sp. NKZ332]